MDDQYPTRSASAHLAPAVGCRVVRLADRKLHDLYDMALLQMGYRHAMDTFIEAVREDIRTSPIRHFLSDRAPRPTPYADGPLSELIPYVLDMHPEYILIPQADMRLQARDLMLDAEPTNDQVLDMIPESTRTGHRPRQRTCDRVCSLPAQSQPRQSGPRTQPPEDRA